MKVVKKEGKYYVVDADGKVVSGPYKTAEEASSAIPDSRGFT